ncbi:hypothetical protein M2132_001586 [Dysgonomonas sp. PH5-45]|uniref:DUF4924 family protein n=1 Tax=unclassified Dysgonomonas TaxID=2630389 RepID=UPI002473BB92|nr:MULTISPECIES: DUF4924 family protein [unclassified Dysgonomonas]MDH6355248.1 hypothetical protein [Dysgonomonas sp. PH5-45]MDH6388130.1 hypothetical protein [Dysgonomonas sp. PH5-37]
MLIAQQKKKENIAEYLLYMWQVEDLIRANGLDINKIQQNIIDKFNQPEDVKQQIHDWYANLVEMMRLEHVAQTGHLQINKNIIIDLTDLHLRLQKSPQEAFYTTAYYNALPYIVELRAKNKKTDVPEIETCFEALYGFLLLRMQNKEVSAQTQTAIKQISAFLRILAEKYRQERDGELEL